MPTTATTSLLPPPPDYRPAYGTAHTDTNVKELYRNLSAFALLCSEEIGSELLVRTTNEARIPLSS